MATREPLHIGIVGARGRGGSFRQVFEALEGVRVRAICDLPDPNAESLDDVRARLGADEAYADYHDMLARSDLDAVLIGTPMPLHVPQALDALRQGVAVLSEVPAGVTIEECRELVIATRETGALYAMAENYIFTRPNMLVRELSRQGLFGTPYYAEGEYIHELKELNEITPWRRKWQTGINGVTYGTHSLGPILQWMPGERVVSVCCAGSGHHYRDPRGDLYENEDSCVMLCKMQSGGLAKIRVDMLSDRPHAMHNHCLQGTDGCYESARTAGERHRVWLRAHSDDPNAWRDLFDFEEHLPSFWREGAALAERVGHGGGDLFELLDFCEALRGEHPPMVGIHEAMDMTLPGLVSQRSILEGGRWLDVPDSRAW